MEYSELVIKAITEAQEADKKTDNVFKVGRTYKARYGTSADIILEYKVISRTSSTITVLHDGKKSTKRINKKLSEYSKCEALYPEGQFSMCPVLRAM